ncbi:MAG: DUF72 domain-containing protein [Candidatus Heimdallarchaeaceae archaeon]
MIKVGCCGWSYLDCKQYFGENWKEKFLSKLQAYAKLFPTVEINSTFYRIPRITTAQRWRKEVDMINPDFEFTIKCSQIITHKDKFSSRTSIWAFNQMKHIAKALRARTLLFQTPSSFKPSKENLNNVKKFFNSIKRNNFILVWEVRWEKDWIPEIVEELFSELGINQCVDPFRQDCFFSKDIIYYRLHGLGKPSMYSYQFSDNELKQLLEKIRKRKNCYVFFNNMSCYEDALKFNEMLS